MTIDRNLKIKCLEFDDNGFMPIKNTGFGIDVSPSFTIVNICDEAVSVAIVMDDLDVPFLRNYTHWLIWNIPAAREVPGAIPRGPFVAKPNAVQGLAYGKHRYKGPFPPIIEFRAHRYVFRFFVLDCFLDIHYKSQKKDLIKAIEGHILQEGIITGKYKR